MPANKFSCGFYQRTESVGIQRLGVLFIPAHGPGADQGWFGLTVFDHRNRPAVVIFILQDPGGPAGANPNARLFDFGCVFQRVSHTVIGPNRLNPGDHQAFGPKARNIYARLL